jgi:hypothetical protein
MSPKRQTITILLVVFLLIGGWMLWLLAWARSIEPAGPTLAEHLAHRPAAEERRVFIKDGQEHLALFGSTQVLPKPPSGPPVYIFDSTGQFVDWTIDMGDDNKFHERWPELFSGRVIGVEEVNAWRGSGR